MVISVILLKHAIYTRTPRCTYIYYLNTMQKIDISVICIWRVYFSSNSHAVFFFELIGSGVSGSKLTDLLYLLWFKDKHNRKGTTAEFQNLNFLILYPIVMQFFAKWSSLWTIRNYFIFKRGIKETKIQKFHIFGRHI